VKVGTTGTAKKVKKTPEPVSRVWHSVVDPILHPVKDESAGVITPEPEKNKIVAVAEVSPVVVHPQPEPTADDPAVQVQPTAEINTDAAASAQPGLVSRMWHSVVDPILHPTKPEPNDDEKLAAGHDVEEKPEENQPNVQQETEPEGEIVPSTPEEVPDQPKVETVESVPVIPDEKAAGKDRKKKSNRKKKSQQKDRALMSLM
jgi:hypothetical protein